MWGGREVWGGGVWSREMLLMLDSDCWREETVGTVETCSDG